MTKILLVLVAVIVLLWGGLTLWVQQEGSAFYSTFGEPESARHALIVFDPDPFYNLDEQVCEGFAKGLAESGKWQVQVASVARARSLRPEVDLYVLCANTYNWAPDQALTYYIEEELDLADKEVVALTVGSGSTARAQRLLEEQLQEKGAAVLASEAYWLMRPNDEERMEEENVVVAVDRAKTLGRGVE